LFIDRRVSARLRALLLAATSLIAGCTEQTPYAPSAREYVVHAVLDARVRRQFVLLEYSNGSPTAQNTVRNALVTLTAPNGRTYAAQQVPDTVRGYSAPGTPSPPVYIRTIYLIDLDAYGDSITVGETYGLRILVNGVDISGETTIPGGIRMSPAAVVDTFYRTRDTLALAWNKSDGARSYQLVLSESGVARYARFAELNVSLPGTATMTNVRNDKQEPIFVQDVRYDVSVLAVDANYYRYFSNESGSWQSSTGRSVSLRGALGVFGSVAPVVQRRILVK
jgi:hypothetical protein